MRRTLNVRFLLTLVLTVVLLAGGGWLLHRFQSDRHARTFLARAAAAEQADDLDAAEAAFSRYLALRPKDVGAMVGYGLVLARRARTLDERVSAVGVLDRALRAAPDRHDARRRLVTLAMSPGVGRLVEVDPAAHLQVLMRAIPNDAELEDLFGQVEAARGHDAEAVEWFSKSVAHDPRRVETYLRQASVLRYRLKRETEADHVILTLGERAKHGSLGTARQVAALVGAARYWSAQGKFEQASDFAGKALELAPDGEESLETAALVAVQGPKPDVPRARRLLTRAIEAHPQSPAFYATLAGLEQQAGDRSAATACLERGLQALPGHPELLWSLADLVLDGDPHGARDRATELLARLRQTSCPTPLADFHQARLLMNQENFLAASQLLDGIRPELAGQPALGLRAELLLGECYRQLGSADRRYAAYRRACAIDPLNVPAQRGLADALARLGRHDEALQACQTVAGRAPGVRLDQARILLEKTRHEPAEKRNWSAVEESISRADADLPGSAEVLMLRGELLVARGNTREALDLYRRALKTEQPGLGVWLAVAALEARADSPDRASKSLDEARRRLGDQVPLRLARAGLVATDPRSVEKLVTLAGDRTGFSRAEQRQLLRGLAEVAMQAGNPALADRFWTESLALQPDDLAVQARRFDAAMQAGDEHRVTGLLDELRRIDGDSGATYRAARAFLLVWQGEKSPTTDESRAARLDEAGALLAQVAQVLPNWARVPLTEARLLELKGRPADAIPAYQRAVDLGESSPGVIRRLAEMLTAQRRYAEADRALARLPERPAGSTDGTDLSRLAAEVAARRGESKRALSLARQAVTAQSRSANDLIWLGQLLWAAGERSEADQTFRRAVDVDPFAAEPWVALVRHLVRSGQPARAVKATDDAERALRGPGDALALAGCAEAVGDVERARTWYERAAHSRPDDPVILRAVAVFQLRTGALPAAEITLRRLIGLPSAAPADAAWARRTLTIALAASPDYPTAKNAFDALEATKPAETDSVEDVRLRAVVLAIQKRRGPKRQAVRLLEGLHERQPLSAEDQFLLAQLLAGLGEWPRARPHFLAALAASPENPVYLETYLRNLLHRPERYDTRDVEAGLDRLETIRPDALSALDLRARWLVRENRRKEASALLGRFADSHPSQAEAVAHALEGIGDLAGAEQSYRRLVTSGPPPAALALAGFLGRHDRLSEALELCDGAWATCPPELVATAELGLVYRAGSVPAAALRRFDERLTRAVANPAHPPVLDQHLAALRNFQGRYDDAIRLYRDVVRREPRNVLALNNLAFLLAMHQGQGDEAAELLARAERSFGPVPSLIDTRAVVHIRAGRGREVIDQLEAVVEESPSAAGYFHLAQARHAAKDRAGAALALAEARKRIRTTTDLHALERDAYQKLSAELGLAG